jgi:hypothetical protein
MGISQVLDLCSTPRSTSEDLSLENSSSTARVSYISDSRMASTFPLYTVRSRECKSLTALSWSSYGSAATLALMLFSITMKHFYGLTREMSEILVLSPIGRKEPSLKLSVSSMSIL